VVESFFLQGRRRRRWREEELEENDKEE